MNAAAQSHPGVVDSQVHLNLLGDVDAAVAALDVVGVDAVIIDEWWGYDDSGTRLPHYRLPNGAARHLYPFSEEASARFPDRFFYTTWIDRNDPGLEGVMDEVAAHPQRVAIRLVLRPDLGDDVALESGDFDTALKLAGERGITVKIILASTDLDRREELLHRVMRRHAEVTFVVDHCGVILLSSADVARGLKVPETLSRSRIYADLPNVNLLWAHAPVLSQQGFPFADVLEQLAGYVDAYGADRLIWASDFTHNERHHTWAESLFSVRGAEVIDEATKELLLGANARRIFGLAPTSAPVSASAPASTWRRQPMLADHAAALDARRR